jgi:signal transduction histidine kinase
MMNPHILLVDDEEDIRDVLAISLSDIGHEVLLAENGDEALRIFKEKNPPIVLTDIKMPGMDGIELLRKIKRENPETEVIMITGHGDIDLAIKSLKFEATDFITKPINDDVMMIALKRAQDRIVIRQKLREYTENLERLIQEKTALQDHLSSLGLMLGSISHGIKGLLTGLDGGMYLVDTGFDKKDLVQVQEGWDTVKFMVERIRRLVLDILFYAKKRDLQWEQVDVLTLAEEVARIVEVKFKVRSIQFEKDFQDGLGNFQIDYGSISSTLINVLENAVEACMEDTSKEAHRIGFRVRQEKQHIIFEVEDNGIGMEKETREKMFTLFFSSKGRHGTGLGMYVSNKIIQQHGGGISVVSRPGEGTTVSVRLPIIPPDGTPSKDLPALNSGSSF